MGLDKGATHIVPHRFRRRHKGGATVACRPNITHHVKVLCKQEQAHNFLGRGSFDLTLKVYNTTLETIYNGFALLGDTDTTQVLGFRLGFCTLDLKNLVSFSSFCYSKLETLGRVDFIHGILDTLVGIEVGNECIENLISIIAHGFAQGILDGKSQFFLGFKDGIQFQSRQLSTHDIKHMSGNLLSRIGQGVECLIRLFTKNLILDTHNGSEEDIIKSLCFDTHV
mmetsp:Transcript_12987/g.23508  ORF Transcript_12987/g.23508 Transcript_12987/m.23508 type:complete len:225 (-) Transcript_12987:354-1028(-)